MKNFIKRITRAARETPANSVKRQLILDRLEDRTLFDAAAMFIADDLESADVSEFTDPLLPSHGMELDEVADRLDHASSTADDDRNGVDEGPTGDVFIDTCLLYTSPSPRD